MREFCTSGSTEGPGRFPGLLDVRRAWREAPGMVLMVSTWQAGWGTG